jgi:hypothetical protein
MEIKRPGCEADHSHPSSAKVKECVEIYTCTPPICLHGMVLSLKKSQGQLYLYLYLYLPTVQSLEKLSLKKI